jgi:hypothetical protein
MWFHAGLRTDLLSLGLLVTALREEAIGRKKPIFGQAE